MKIAQPSNVLGYLPIYLGIEGTNHELVSVDSAKSAIEAVIKNQCDIAICDPFMLDYIDYEKNQLIIVAGFSNKIFHSVITFNPFINNESDFKNKNLVSFPEPSTGFFLARNLKQKYKIAQIIQTPFNTELGPLLTQEADIAITMEPNTTYAKKNGAKELLNFSNIEAVMTGFIVTKKKIKENKVEIIKLLTKIRKGIVIFHDDPKKALNKAIKEFPLINPEILETSLNAMRRNNIYCSSLRFTKNEILKGLDFRNIKMKYGKISDFISYLE